MAAHPSWGNNSTIMTVNMSGQAHRQRRFNDDSGMVNMDGSFRVQFFFPFRYSEMAGRDAALRKRLKHQWP
jgi:hypothetical protein